MHAFTLKIIKRSHIKHCGAYESKGCEYKFLAKRLKEKKDRRLKR
ncbi:hypothetical protein [Borreliella valaisiana]|uniref:Uncharacterized protein n=1 Tax=Borreliella valaisiana VS116 TaxID=445987 RepID=C0R8M6_BORVA|nr:hypothetical protein [Borreliella valaisiana]ACN52782.1 hypothetical protein BVAVS116_K0032 [Borreliella valaisiana VS116]